MQQLFKIYILLLLLSFVSLYSTAQNKKEVNSLLNLAIKNLYSKPELTRKYAQKVLKIAKSKQLNKEIIISTRMIGNSYTIQAQHQEAIRYYLKALSIAQKQKNIIEESKTYNTLGVLYEQRKYYKKASNPKVKDLEHTSNVLYNLGNVYLKLNETEAALSNFFKTIEIRKKHKISGSLSAEYSSIGVIYTKQKKYVTALEYLQQAHPKHKTQEKKESKSNCDRLVF